MNQLPQNLELIGEDARMILYNIPNNYTTKLFDMTLQKLTVLNNIYSYREDNN